MSHIADIMSHFRVIHLFSARKLYLTFFYLLKNVCQETHLTSARTIPVQGGLVTCVYENPDGRLMAMLSNRSTD
jgi:hypothetical protein